MISKIKKYFLIILLFLFFIFPINEVYADDVIYTEGYLQYTINDEAITIVCYYGDNKNVTIPRTIGGYEVKQIASNSFTDSVAEEVHIPDSVSFIGSSTFKKDTRLYFYDAFNESVQKSFSENIFEGYVPEHTEPEPVDPNPTHTDPSPTEQDPTPGSNQGQSQNTPSDNTPSGDNKGNKDTSKNNGTEKKNETLLDKVSNLLGLNKSKKDETKKDDTKKEDTVAPFDDTLDENIDSSQDAQTVNDNQIDDLYIEDDKSSVGIIISVCIIVGGCAIVIGYFLYKRFRH